MQQGRVKLGVWQLWMGLVGYLGTPGYAWVVLSRREHDISSDEDQDIQGRIEWRGEGDGRDGGGSGRHLSRPVLSASASVQLWERCMIRRLLCHFTPYSTAKLNELSRKTIICLIKSLNLWKCNFSPTGLIQHTCK